MAQIGTGPCSAEAYTTCIENYSCCLSQEQLFTIISYLMAKVYSRDMATVKEMLDAMPSGTFENQGDIYRVFACFASTLASDTDTGLAQWAAAQDAAANSGINFSYLSDQQKFFIIMAGFCQYLASLFPT